MTLSFRSQASLLSVTSVSTEVMPSSMTRFSSSNSAASSLACALPHWGHHGKGRRERAPSS
jgi:hypothetical protein